MSISSLQKFIKALSQKPAKQHWYCITNKIYLRDVMIKFPSKHQTTYLKSSKIDACIESQAYNHIWCYKVWANNTQTKIRTSNSPQFCNNQLHTFVGSRRPGQQRSGLYKGTFVLAYHLLPCWIGTSVIDYHYYVYYYPLSFNSLQHNTSNNNLYGFALFPL